MGWFSSTWPLCWALSVAADLHVASDSGTLDDDTGSPDLKLQSPEVQILDLLGVSLSIVSKNPIANTRSPNFGSAKSLSE